MYFVYTIPREFQEHIGWEKRFYLKVVFVKSNEIVTKSSLNFSLKNACIFFKASEMWDLYNYGYRLFLLRLKLKSQET